MKFSQLSKSIQFDIAQNQMDKCDSLDDLTAEDISYLDLMDSDDLFNAWCNWNGFLGWSHTITRVFREINS